MIAPDISLKIAQWRQQAAEGTLTQDAMKEIILVLRENRMQAATTSASTKRKTAAKTIPSAGDLLSELEGL